MQLSAGHSLYSSTNSVHRSCSTDSYFQLGSREAGLTAQAELFCQIIGQSCFYQLRTREQLGYIVKSGLRR